MNKYEHIINYDYVMKHQRMPISLRCFEFAPFSALTGYKDLIMEKGREVTSKRILTDEKKELLDNKLRIINSKINTHPMVNITFFIKDKYKDGGKYEKINNYLKKIDFYQKIIIMEDGCRINFDNIVEIDSFDINFNDIL